MRLIVKPKSSCCYLCFECNSYQMTVFNSLKYFIKAPGGAKYKWSNLIVLNFFFPHSTTSENGKSQICGQHWQQKMCRLHTIYSDCQLTNNHYGRNVPGPEKDEQITLLFVLNPTIQRLYADCWNLMPKCTIRNIRFLKFFK